MGTGSRNPGRSGESTATGSRAVLVFTAVTLAFSWVMWAPLVAGTVSTAGTAGASLKLAGAFGPAAGAVATLRLQGRSVRRWLGGLLTAPTPPGWFAAVVVLPPTVLALAAVVHVGIGSATFGLDPRITLAGYPFTVLSIAVLGGGQEEFGWRGYLLPALRKQWGPVSSSVVVGLVWAGWHSPLFLVPGSEHSQLPVASYLLLVLAVSVLLTWLFEAAGGSVLVAMLFHAGLNAYAYYPAGGLVAARSALGYSLIAGVYFVLAALVALGPLRRLPVQLTPQTNV